MEYIEVKKEQYEVIERLNSYLLKVKKDDQDYMLYDFNGKHERFLDFKFAYKRLKVTGILIPKLLVLDKKCDRALVEYLSGPTAFDLLIEKDLDEKIIEQVFNINYRARINQLRLDFDPRKFIYHDDKLYYTAFTFSQYYREEDFTQKEIRLWFYTNEFKNLLIEKGIAIDKGRLKNEYERNKEIVLTVVKFFK